MSLRVMRSGVGKEGSWPDILERLLGQHCERENEKGRDTGDRKVRRLPLLPGMRPRFGGGWKISNRYFGSSLLVAVTERKS